MTIGYNKKRLRSNLYISIVWFIIGVIQIGLMKDQYWLGLGWIVLAVLFLISFLYKSKKKYITITDQYIKQNLPFGKTIKLEDLESINYFSEEYIIKSETQEIRVNTNLIEEGSQAKLKKILLDCGVRLYS